MKPLIYILLWLIPFVATAQEVDSLAVAHAHDILNTSANGNIEEPQPRKQLRNKPQGRGRKKMSIYPTIGLWRNNYFATGLSTNKPVSQYSADAKFRISMALRLWNIKGKADIFFTYSQLSVWDIYQESCPFRESAYNPGVWAAWQVTPKTRLLFGAEHESNGLSGSNSRSFNYLTVAFLYEPYPHWRFGGRAWYGYYDHDNIDNYFRYRGYFQLWATYHTLNDRLSVTALVNPTNYFRNYNIQIEASWRMAKRGDWIPSLYIQYMSGYGDTMLDYNRYASKIRIGISLVNNKLGLY